MGRGPHRPDAARLPQPPKKKGFFRRFWWVFFVVPLIVVAGIAGTLFYVYQHLEIPVTPPGAQTTYVYDRHGHVITTLHAEVDRTEVPLDQISIDLQHAVIAIEDHNFYREGGVSPTAILRATWADITHRGLVQGGSTITQQYVRTVYLSNEQTFARKVKEAMLAVKISHRYSKQQILTKYLNAVYFGHGAYGAQAAAETYFGVPASGLLRSPRPPPSPGWSRLPTRTTRSGTRSERRDAGTRSWMPWRSTATSRRPTSAAD